MGLFVYNTTCSDAINVVLLQQENSISGSFQTTCFGNDGIAISGTLEGHHLSVTLLHDGQEVALLSGTAYQTEIMVHNSSLTTSLHLRLDY